MKDEWTLALATGLLATALLSVLLHAIQAPREDQAAVWIIGAGVSALWALNVSARRSEQDKNDDENQRDHDG